MITVFDALFREHGDPTKSPHWGWDRAAMQPEYRRALMPPVESPMPHEDYVTDAQERMDAADEHNALVMINNEGSGYPVRHNDDITNQWLWSMMHRVGAYQMANPSMKVTLFNVPDTTFSDPNRRVKPDQMDWYQWSEWIASTIRDPETGRYTDQGLMDILDAVCVGRYKHEGEIGGHHGWYTACHRASEVIGERPGIITLSWAARGESDRGFMSDQEFADDIEWVASELKRDVLLWGPVRTTLEDYDNPVVKAIQRVQGMV